MVVSAPQDLIGQIEAIIAQLDSYSVSRQSVAMYELRNATPQEVLKVMQEIFQKNGASQGRNEPTQTDALETRSTTQSQENNSNNRTGLGGNAGGAGGTGIGGAGTGGTGAGNGLPQ